MGAVGNSGQFAGTALATIGRASRRLAGTIAVVMAVTLAAEVPAAAAPGWQPPKPKDVPGVAVKPVRPKQRPAWTAADREVRGTPKVTWPSAGAATVDLAVTRGTARGAATGSRRVQAGSLPVSVANAPTPAGQDIVRGSGAPTPIVDQVRVEVANRPEAARAGVSGLVLKVSRADGVRQAGEVEVQVDYSGFAGAYGGDWASRLRMMTLPDGRPLITRNNTDASTLTAAVPLAADGSAVTLAVAAAAAGDNGDYTATSLTPASTWQVSQQTGAFAWSYPLRVVPGVGGPEPALSLSYSAGSIDGRTGGTNTQGSWVGDGWELWPGYIERTYKSCADDKDAMRDNDPNNTSVLSWDLCWLKPEGNATISLNGQATELVKSSGNTWKGVIDDGSKIELLKNTAFDNGDNDGEYWKVTSIDGTQYFFGRNKGQGGASASSASNSVWTAPVYGNHPDEPGYQAGSYAGSRETQAWRWNLDYVVDPHGNTMRYFYERETGAYGREGDPTKRTTYHRGGHLTRIEYGSRSDASSTTQPAARVVFDVDERCGSNCWSGTDPVEASWPDTPWDLYCKESPCTEQLSPTFWTQKRLSRIRAQVYAGSGTSYNEVEWWTLRHTYLQAGTNEGKPMWLAGITRTGKVTTAGGIEVSDPEVVFDPGSEALPNRVDAMADGRPSLFRYRINTITTASGAQIVVSYSSPQCTRSTLPAVDSNGKRCFPQYYAPSGEEPTLDWFHKYVVTEVDTYDNTGGFSQEKVSYHYLDSPAWRYDDSELINEEKRTWGQFRGYGQVQVRRGLGSGVQSATEYLYLRGMDGDKRKPSGTKDVWVTDSQGRAVEDHEAFAGMLLEEETTLGPGGALVSGTINTPVKQGPTATSGPLKAWMTNTETVRTRIPLADGTTRWTKTVTTFNSDNLPTTVDDLGDESTAEDDRCTRTWYARNNANWMLSRVKRVETVGVNCAATPTLPGDMLSSVRTTYDAATNDWNTYLPVRGEVAKVEEIDSWTGSTPNWVTTGRTTYDVNGRVTESYDALNRRTATSYTPAVAGPVTSTTVTNALQRSVTTTMATAWQLPVTKVDNANSRQTDMTYDGLGRMLKVWLPGREKAAYPTGPNLEFVYRVRNDAPSAVTTKTLLPSTWQAKYRTSTTLFDGLLRERQTQTQATGGGRVLTDTVYDSRGLLAWKTNPYYDNSGAPPSTTLVTATGLSAFPSLVENEYDGAERITDAIFKSYGVEKWRTTTLYSGGDRTVVTPPAGGTKTASIRDARGQTAELRQYHSHTSTTFDATRYIYTDRGELTTVVDSAGNNWKYAYDQRGRKIKEEDPDRGVTTSTYDVVGQLTTVTDARNITLAYTYDDLGRRTSLREGSVNGPKRAEWVYDTLPNGVGKLTKSIRYEPAGSTNAYTNAITAYDAAGRATTSKVTIPASEGGLCAASAATPCDYAYTTAYFQNGMVDSVTVPAAGGLDSEKLYTVYSDIGVPKGLHSTQQYAGDTHNKINQVIQRVLGGGNKRTQLTYSIDQATNRVTNVNAVPELKPEAVDVTYSYDPAGNITKISDEPQDGSADTQCFTYDYLGQLTQAWTPSSADCTIAPSLEELAGPAPYWRSYSVDKSGNRLSETIHGSPNTVRTYTYPEPGGAPGSKPHAVSRVDTTGTVSESASFTYDAAGNMTTRPGVTSGQTLTWDGEGHLATSADSTGTTSFVYDADGNRLIRRDPAGATLYLPGGTEVRAPTSGAALGTRYYSHMGALVAMRTVTGVTWLVSDHHGTAEVAINASDLSTARRRTLPFGEERQSPVGTWPAAMDKGFVGGTKDNTGLTHLSAREYDPALGRFISVDPIMDLADPLQWNGYAYANNSPVTLSDPTGLRPDCGGGVGNYKCTNDYPKANQKENPGNWNLAPSQQGAPWRNAGPDDPEPILTPAQWLEGVYRGPGPGRAVADLTALDVRQGMDLYFCHYNPDICTERERAVQKQAFFELTGIADIQGCFGEKSGWSCFWLFAGFVPFGRLKFLAGPFRAVDDVADVAKVACSFSGDTKILMADGTSKEIEDVKVGDLVLAADPETGKQGPRVVTQLWIHEDTTVGLAAGSKVIQTTEDHPFWNATDQQWQRADALDRGDLLLTATGGHVPVDGLVPATARATTAYNVTVTDLHTYYVMAGNTPVLVHNTGPGGCVPNWSAKSRPTFGHTFSTHGAGAKNTRALTDRARSTGQSQGQWLDDNAAADFLRGVHVDNAGPRSVRIPDGLGQVIMPDGSIVQARAATLVPGANGLYKTAYPILGPQ